MNDNQYPFPRLWIVWMALSITLSWAVLYGIVRGLGWLASVVTR